MPNSPTTALVSADKYRDGYTSFRVRTDLADSLRTACDEVHRLGGILTSSGGLRDVTAPVTPGRSRTSLHYLGRAIDLYIRTGMQSENDPYPVVQDGEVGGKPRWKVLCRSGLPEVSEQDVQFAVWRKGRDVRIFARRMRCFCLTDILENQGWLRINSRTAWKTNYMCVEWWHFQNETDLVVGATKFGDELRKVWSEEAVARSGLALSAVWRGRYFT